MSANSSSKVSKGYEDDSGEAGDDEDEMISTSTVSRTLHTFYETLSPLVNGSLEMDAVPPGCERRDECRDDPGISRIGPYVTINDYSSPPLRA